MPYHHKIGLSALTTWHSQSGLLLISASWGASYLMPTRYRMPFSEVFPPTMERSFGGSMWVWGVLLLVPSVLALIIDQLAVHHKISSKPLWNIIFGSHILLSGVYLVLATAALVSGLQEIPGTHYPHPPFWAGFISVLSRPVLWSYIGYLHTTFARLPEPEIDEDKEDEDEKDGSADAV